MSLKKLVRNDRWVGLKNLKRNGWRRESTKAPCSVTKWNFNEHRFRYQLVILAVVLVLVLVVAIVLVALWTIYFQRATEKTLWVVNESLGKCSKNTDVKRLQYWEKRTPKKFTRGKEEESNEKRHEHTSTTIQDRPHDKCGSYGSMSPSVDLQVVPYKLFLCTSMPILATMGCDDCSNNLHGNYIRTIQSAQSALTLHWKILIWHWKIVKLKLKMLRIS